MNKKAVLAAGRTMTLVAPVALFGCWASSWTRPIATFPASLLTSQYGDTAGQVLILPLWQAYRDPTCETAFFFAPPVMLDATELSRLTDHLRLYEDKATVCLFMHPTWRLLSSLLGTYIVYPDGQVVWAGNAPRDPWNEFQAAKLGVHWQASLLAGVQTGSLALSEQAAARTLYILPADKTAFPTCESKPSLPCCYADRIAFEFDSSEQRIATMRYLEALPTGQAIDSTEAWSKLTWAFSSTTDVVPNNALQRTHSRVTPVAGRAQPARR